MRKIFTSIFISLFFLWAQSFAGSIPDPGQIKCYSNSKELPECPQPEEQFYGQDAQYITTPQSYTKLSSKGFPLPDSARNQGCWNEKSKNLATDNDCIRNFNIPVVHIVCTGFPRQNHYPAHQRYACQLPAVRGHLAG